MPPFIILYPMTTWKADFGCCFSENADTSFNSEPEEIIIPQGVRDIADKASRDVPNFFMYFFSLRCAISEETVAPFSYCSYQLFYGNHEAAENTAIICSLLGSHKERGIAPKE